MRLLICILNLWFCMSSSFAATNESSVKPTEASTNTKLQGNCLQSNPPGSSENQLSPCDKVALQLIYQKGTQHVISIVRTRPDGTFDIEFPKDSPWQLTSTSTKWKEKVEILKNPDGTQKVVVILKPEKAMNAQPEIQKKQPLEKSKSKKSH